ncbi:lysozyme [Streptomyces longispororuber]|uniref:lysozyme n=1 Tax=Streptomyces longispororuber TaxID=68230 RepID=UPI00210BEB80|nr:lysozyme [Streptomyces longispororuber]MCQ4208303.1 lysozyme [Streptomyces longispororuber]
MPVHKHRPTGRRRLGVAGTLLAALSLLFTLPSAAQAADVPQRGEAFMGIGVAAHDGDTGKPPVSRAVQTEGVDVSSHQGNVAWSTLWNSGVKWAYVKATEGTYYTNPYFAQQYNGSYNVGMIRGSYHFATPDTTSGATQANYFVDHGGGWSKDGKTLPGALDIEWNPYGAACYGKTQSAMVTWIRDFVNQYKARTGRDPVIYTATSWWTQCTGNSSAFGTTNPLWVARYASDVGTLPAGWGYYTMWQYTSSGPTVGDHNKFNGALDRVQALANG